MGNLEKNFRGMTPYIPGEQPQIKDKIKLNTNENPYPPSPCVQRVLKEYDASDLKLYPDPNMTDIRQKIAEHFGVKIENVFTGVGSDDVLATAFMAFFNSGKPVFFPDVTYAFYDVWAELFKVPYARIPLNDDFEIVKEDYYAENGGIVFPNPNAPTGVMMSLSDIEDILCHNTDTIVVVDEAYVDFGCESAVKLTEKYKNLVVTQTFSKSRSMAGARIGFAISNDVLISEMFTIRNSYNSYTMPKLTERLAIAALDDEEYFKETISKIIKTRENYKKKLADLGFSFPDSKSNFIFASHPKYSARELFDAMKAHNIFVRYFDKPRIDNYLRITVGTDEEMEKLMDFLRGYMNI